MSFVFILILVIVNFRLTFSCKDDNGKSVDWFLVYKLPKGNFCHDKPGSRYVYITNRSIAEFPNWVLSTKLINSPNSILSRNFKPLYSQKNTRFSHLFYNDDPPNVKSDKNLAHAKGSLIFSNNHGSWLLHSIPNFPPPVNQTYNYPNTGLVFGQTVFCVSFEIEESAGFIAKHLSLLRPKIYSQHLTKSLLKKVPELKNLVNKVWSESNFGSTKIKTKQGLTLYGFGKNGKSKNDLYTELIANNLSISLLVETWRRGAGGSKPSDCNFKNQVANINRLQVNFLNELKETFQQKWTYLEDHSKWAISGHKNSPFVCIGDVNRMKSQIKRGGGAICMEHLSVWQVFRNLIEDVELCVINHDFTFHNSHSILMVVVILTITRYLDSIKIFY